MCVTAALQHEHECMQTTALQQSGIVCTQVALFIGATATDIYQHMFCARDCQKNLGNITIWIYMCICIFFSLSLCRHLFRRKHDYRHASKPCDLRAYKPLDTAYSSMIPLLIISQDFVCVSRCSVACVVYVCKPLSHCSVAIQPSYHYGYSLRRRLCS